MSKDLEEKLQEVTRRLNTTKEEFDKFAFSIGHDLRAPLTHIMGFLQLLEERISDDLEDKAQEYFKIIKDSTLRLGAMLDALLTYSRLARTEIKMVQVNLDNLVKETLMRVQKKTTHRTIQWTIAKLPSVTGDPTLLKKALENLIDNAIKFTAHSEHAQVEIGVEQPQENQWIIFVRDNGAGFDDTRKSKLFGLFQRLHAQTEFEGLGVGLAMVRKIMHMHGGEADATSMVGKGATFYLHMPITQ